MANSFSRKGSRPRLDQRRVASNIEKSAGEQLWSAQNAGDGGLSIPKLPQINVGSLVETKLKSGIQNMEANHQKAFDPSWTICKKSLPSRLHRSSDSKIPFGRIKNPGSRDRENIANLSGVTGRTDGNSIVETHHQGGQLHFVNQGKAKITPVATSTSQRSVFSIHRQIKAGRKYKIQDNQMSYEELLVLDEKMDKMSDLTSTERELHLKDFCGREINTSHRRETENNDITAYIPWFAFQKDEPKNSGIERRSLENNSENKQALNRETRARVEGRFFEALDLRFYHYYLGICPGRRSAICDEIERRIFIDNVSLSWYRDNLRLREILDSWML